MKNATVALWVYQRYKFQHESQRKLKSLSSGIDEQFIVKM